MASLQVKREPTPLPPGTAACIGAFDGLHLGHRALLETARQMAPRLALVTFEPHPGVVLGRGRDPRLLTTSVQRRRLCRALGVDTLVILHFTADVAELDPHAFVRRYLLDGLRPRAVVVGADFRFGRNRSGDIELLEDMLSSASIGFRALPKVPPPPKAEYDELSSTNIRRALNDGNMEAAAAMLGRWHAVAGTVVAGAKRGRAIGYPTANVDAPGAFMPRAGIYAVALAVWDPSSSHFGAVWPAVASLGTNPTFTPDAAALVLEVHVLDRDLGDDLYGVEVEVSFIHRLRDEVEFKGTDALIEQIHADVDAARPHLTEANLEYLVSPTRDDP